MAVSLLVGLISAGCRSGSTGAIGTSDPTAAEIRLPTKSGFDAYLVHQGDCGIWTVACLDVFERYGCPDIVALDDKGRCIILNSNSGKWTPSYALQDGQWLGGVSHADVDPRRAGAELYVGGKSGNLYQVVPHRQGGFDVNLIAHFPGEEIYTLVAGDLDAAHAGTELIAFTSPGALYAITPSTEPGASFEVKQLQSLPGRVRDAVVIQDPAQAGYCAVTVSRTGDVRILRLDGGRPVWTNVYHTDMGIGRIAARPRVAGEPVVLYVTCDDGRIVRLEQTDGERFRVETIHTGPQGPRGIAAGRFAAEPGVETVAVYGYSRKVDLLTRRSAEWSAETIFEDVDKGHWLAIGELDGRNATDELIVSGYGSRVVLLARPPGYGLSAPGRGGR